MGMSVALQIPGTWRPQHLNEPAPGQPQSQSQPRENSRKVAFNSFHVQPSVNGGENVNKPLWTKDEWGLSTQRVMGGLKNLRDFLEMDEGEFDKDGCIRPHKTFPHPQIFQKGTNNKEMKTSKPKR